MAGFPHLLASWFAPTFWALLWLALFAATVALVTLLRTRWSAVKPWKKCALLSFWVHVLLACLAATIRITSSGGPGIGPGDGGPIRVAFLTAETTDEHEDEPPPKGDDPTPANEPAPIQAPAEPKQVLDAEPAPKPAEPQPNEEPKKPESPLAAPDLLASPTPPKAKPVKMEKLDEAPPATAEKPTPVKEQDSPKKSADVTAAAPTPDESSSPAVAAESSATRSDAAAAAPASTPGVADGQAGAKGSRTGLPAAYAARFAADRDALVAGGGGSPATEHAVRSALAWLAAAQSPDGRWDPKRFGAGQERYVLGQDRGGAGAKADAGMTGLALLALLAAGHTHREGPYAVQIARGLDYLRKIQGSDGNLAGNAELFARMYCHSMATFALSEAYAMTHDEKLAPAVRAAVNYSLAVQHPTDGGWRYRPGDTGDTSQLGWQLMALKSAELGGVAIPPATWTRVDRFLRGVKRGTSGGLAAYRPEGPPTRTMTAEALYCRQLMSGRADGGLDHAALDEAVRSLTAEPPTGESVNLYYWYYATLALHRSQTLSAEAADAWRSWNDALTGTLVAAQDEDGSWPPTCIWAGYGGRVYATALAAMNLEVYYRYAPSQVEAGEEAADVARRPGWQSVPSR